MSVESMSKALRVRGLTPTEKLVLIGIANHDGDGGAWPSQATLAAYADCAERSVRRVVNSLVEKGYVTVDLNAGGNERTRGDRRPNLYTLNFDGGTVESSRESDGGTVESEREDIAVSTEPSSNHPSSLRSEITTESSNNAVLTPRASAIAVAYWDWHKANRNGLVPAVPFVGVQGIAKKLLSIGYDDTEIADAVCTARALNLKAVQDEIERNRRIADGRTGPVIPASVIKAFNGATVGWIYERRRDIPVSTATIEAAFFVRQGYGIGETMVRLAIALGAAGDCSELRSAMWNAKVDRFDGELDDYRDAMERAYRNRYWKAS